MVVLMEDSRRGPCVVLAQRSKRQDETITFHRGNWSASVEEQVVKTDGSLNGTVRRGLREELLGKHAENATINTAAIFVERPILNLTVGVICRTTLSFEEIHSCWVDCEDRDEHSQIVALPLKRDLVHGCIRGGELSESARQECLTNPSFERIWNTTDGWKLHPTSALRLALALWAVTAGGLHA